MTFTNSEDFGAAIRQKRKALRLTQGQLAERCGVGLRFIVELEAGKPSCQLGKALTAAVEVGLRLEDASLTQAPEPQPEEDDPLSSLPTFR